MFLHKSNLREAWARTSYYMIFSCRITMKKAQLSFLEILFMFQVISFKGQTLLTKEYFYHKRKPLMGLMSLPPTPNSHRRGDEERWDNTISSIFIAYRNP